MDRRTALGAALAWAGAGGGAAAKVSPKGMLHWVSNQVSPAPAAAAQGPVVETQYGKLVGVQQDGCVVFRSVPYGAPTGGSNRFRPPQKPAAWRGVRPAAAFGSISPQPLFSVIPEENDSEAHEPQGEDCLALHVWTPQVGPGRRPVMVWFHGGGYTVGGGSAPWYHGHRLAARHDVVVVSVNHRLNLFGFLYLAELDPSFQDAGNVGMQDCVAALQWVRDNISAFGGDPHNVTIFGESGGAGKVSCLMAMPAAKGLFHRAIAESGAALKIATPEQATADARGVLTKLGLGPSDIGKLQAMPFTDVLKAAAGGRGLGAGPVADGRSIPTNPFDPGAPQVSADVPFMTGSNLTESTFFPDTPLDPLSDSELQAHVKSYIRADDATANKLVALYRDQHPTRDNVFLYQLISSEYWMRTSVLVQAERKALQARAPAYVYQFNRLSPARGGKLHCPHGSEIPYVFDNLASAPELTGNDAVAQLLADKMSAAWVAFARYGDPNGGSAQIPYWRPYDMGARAVMVFDDECRLELDPDGRGRAAVAGIKGQPA
jgi:para-nitrobenzyl esterase